MTNPLEKLQKKVFGKSSVEHTELTAILDFAREFGCLELILGSESRVYNPSGKLIHIVRKRPISLPVLNKLLQEFNIIKQLEKQESNSLANKMKPKRGRR